MRAPSPLRHLARFAAEHPAGLALLWFLAAIGLVEVSGLIAQVFFNALPFAASAPADVRARAQLAGRLTSGALGAVMLTVPFYLWGRRLRTTAPAADGSSAASAQR